MSAVRRTLTLLAGLFAGFVLSLTVLPAPRTRPPRRRPRPAVAATSTAVQLPAAPEQPDGPKGPKQSDTTDVNVKLSGLTDKPSTSVTYPHDDACSRCCRRSC